MTGLRLPKLHYLVGSPLTRWSKHYSNFPQTLCDYSKLPHLIIDSVTWEREGMRTKNYLLVCTRCCPFNPPLDSHQLYGVISESPMQASQSMESSAESEGIGVIRKSWEKPMTKPSPKGQRKARNKGQNQGPWERQKMEWNRSLGEMRRVATCCCRQASRPQGTCVIKAWRES